MAKIYHKLTVVFVCLLFLFAISSEAQQKTKNTKSFSKSKVTTKKAKYKPWTTVPDVTLLNESGRSVKLFDDVLKNKTVVINFLFSSCQYRCPLQGQKFADLSKALGKRLGKDVFLVSISIDPTYDTPEKLKVFGQTHGRQEGWTLLTGNEVEVNKVLLSLIGKRASGKGEHNSIIVVGKTNDKNWTAMSSTYGLAPTLDILNLIENIQKIS